MICYGVESSFTVSENSLGQSVLALRVHQILLVVVAAVVPVAAQMEIAAAHAQK
jgi:hypothetical protein